MNDILKLLHTAENLKAEMRHSWISNGRQESVAEHTWRMSLMAILLAPRMQDTLDMTRVLTMAIIHDLPEALVGDMPNFCDLPSAVMDQKFQSEKSAMKDLTHLAGEDLSQSLMDAWLEYEHGDSPEAQFVRALDKLEVFLQHIDAGTSRWNEKEFSLFQSIDWLIPYCSHDPALMEFASLLVEKAQGLVLAQQGAA